MKLLLDENIPHPIRRLLVGHDVFTVTYMGWNRILDRKLLSLAADHDFNAVITKDMGIAYEQNVAALPCAVIILQAKSNDIHDITPLIPKLLAALETIGNRKILHIW